MSQAVKMGARLIESRRRTENSYREMDALIATDKKVLQMANFENTTTQKIDRKLKQVGHHAVEHVQLDHPNDAAHDGANSKCSNQRRKNTRRTW